MNLKSTGASGWVLALVSVLSLASAMALRVYFDRQPSELQTLDALKSLLFWGDPGEAVVHAPPLINLSRDNTLLGLSVATATVAVGCLVRASTARDRYEQSQPRAITVVVSLLTLYCLWHAWPLFVQLLTHN